MPSSPFPDRLLAWWDLHGRKDLPWQQPRSPYRVWISEVMLQQTQVSTVIAYFERWMKQLPKLADLAHAREDDVMGLWSGLGYYSRARNLHMAAKICMERWDGQLPESSAHLEELPGIGRSTANAIVSLAHNRPAAILDGNVKRVLARYGGIKGWPGRSDILRQLWSEAESLLPAMRAADYSQAVMDLGALVCTRTRPDCTECPVNDDCEAYRTDAVDSIPGLRPRKKVPTRIVHMLIIQDERGRVLLERRPPSGIWGGLWSLPESSSGASDFADIPESRTVLPELEHRLTHLHLCIKPQLVTLPGKSGLKCPSIRERPDMTWFGPEDRRRIGLPKPVSKILDQLEEKTTA